MSTATIKSLEVAQESTYGSLVSTTGLPSASGLTFYGMDFEAASVTTVGGEARLVESGAATTAFDGLPPELSEFRGADGVKLNARRGELTVTHRVRAWGSGNTSIAAPANMPLKLLLATVTDYQNFGGAALTPTGMGADNGIVTFAAAPGLAVGEVVVANVDGCVIANRVTGLDDTDITFQHYWPRALTGSDAIIQGLNFRILYGASSGTKGASAAIRFSTIDAQFVAYGCRLQSVTWSNDNGVLQAEMSIRVGLILPVVDVGDFVPTMAPRIASPQVLMRGNSLLRTNGGTGYYDAPTVPASLASTRVPFEVEGLSVSMEWTLVPVGQGCGALGESDAEVAGFSCTLSYTSKAPAEDDQRDIADGVARGLTLSGAPVSDGTSNDCAWAVNLPAAHLTTAPDVTAEPDDLISQEREYASSFYQGDSTTAHGVVIFLGGQ